MLSLLVILVGRRLYSTLHHEYKLLYIFNDDSNSTAESNSYTAHDIEAHQQMPLRLFPTVSQLHFVKRAFYILP